MMKRLILVTVLFLVGFGSLGVDLGNAQTDKRLSATPKAFQVFYTKFRKAVVARDKATVASLTRFPFQYGYDAGDEGTYSRAQFLRNFNNIFGDADGIAFFKRTNPSFFSQSRGFELVDESDASHYIFERKGTSYQFTAYMSEP